MQNIHVEMNDAEKIVTHFCYAELIPYYCNLG